MGKRFRGHTPGPLFHSARTGSSQRGGQLIMTTGETLNGEAMGGEAFDGDVPQGSLTVAPGGADEAVPDGQTTPRSLHVLADRMVTRSIVALEAMLGQLEAGQVVPPKDVVTEIGIFRKAVESAFNERKQFGLRVDGDGPDPALDLRAARDEVCRRLACLRAAEGGGSFPEQPE